MTNKRYQTLRLILGDQLNASHSWFQQPQKEVLYVMMEVAQETDYVRHHRQKSAGLCGDAQLCQSANQQRF